MSKVSPPELATANAAAVTENAPLDEIRRAWPTLAPLVITMFMPGTYDASGGLAIGCERAVVCVTVVVLAGAAGTDPLIMIVGAAQVPLNTIGAIAGTSTEPLATTVFGLTVPWKRLPPTPSTPVGVAVVCVSFGSASKPS